MSRSHPRMLVLKFANFPGGIRIPENVSKLLVSSKQKYLAMSQSRVRLHKTKVGNSAEQPGSSFRALSPSEFLIFNLACVS